MVTVLNETDTTPLRSHYAETAPDVPAPAVACLWEQHIGRSAGAYVQRVLPDACADVIVDADGRAVLVGPTSEPALPLLRAGQRVRGLRLRTSAIGAALGVAADGLRDAQVPLDALMSKSAAERIAEQVWSGVSPALPGSTAPDPRVTAALRLLSAPDATVGAVAAALGLSDRRLRRLFSDHTGLEPRTVRRIARLHRFLALAEQAPRPGPLAVLASTAGYADQPHLTRDVHRLSGLSPTALLHERAGGRGAQPGRPRRR